MDFTRFASLSIEREQDDFALLDIDNLQLDEASDNFLDTNNKFSRINLAEPFKKISSGLLDAFNYNSFTSTSIKSSSPASSGYEQRIHDPGDPIDNSDSVIVCRICEDEIPESLMEEHSKFCVAFMQCVLRIQEYDNVVLNQMAPIEKLILNLTDQNERVTFLESLKSLMQLYITSLDVTKTDKVQNLISSWKTVHELAIKAKNYLETSDKQLFNLISHNKIASKVKTLKKKDIAWKKRKELMVDSQSDGTLLQDQKLSKFHSNAALIALPSIHDFEFIKKLSRGASGRVYLAKKKTTGDYFAIKVIPKNRMTSKAQFDRIIAERNILALVDSPFIVKLYYSFQTIENLYMVMDYLNGGDLLSLLESVGKFNESWARFFISETVCAVGHLHSLGIIHRDIKLQNLLIDKKGHLKLADFGLSRQSQSPDSMRNLASTLENLLLEEDEDPSSEAQTARDEVKMNRMNSFVGTAEYLAPEIILGSGYDELVDWWCVGIVLYQLISGKHPFLDETDEKTFENILTRRLSWPKSMSPEVKSLIDGFLTVRVDKRMGALGHHQIQNHAFFKDVDWENLIDMPAIFVPVIDNIEDTRYFNEVQEWSDDSINEAMNSSKAYDGEFVDFEYMNVNNLKAANENAIDTENKQVALNTDKWLDEDDIKPAIIEKQESKVACEVLPEKKPRNVDCLVAEDNKVVQKMAQALLKSIGFHVKCVDNGKQALELARKEKFDVIFMDIMMPEMDGIESTKNIRSEEGPNMNTIIIAFTATGDKYADGQFNDCLAKPFTKADIFAIAKKWLKD